MKTILLSIVMILCIYNSFSQDRLVLKNGDEMKVKVLEVLPDFVKYKKWGNIDGPIYSELKVNILVIKYQNGTKDVFNDEEKTNSNQAPSSNKEVNKSVINPKETSNTKKSLIIWKPITLPITVTNLISKYGNYTKFTLCEEPCGPLGNSYMWELNNGLIINTWARSAGSNDKANKLDKIFAYELTAKNEKVIENLIFGLGLNKTTLAKCKQQFKLIKSSYENSWKFKQGDLYTYLFFNDRGILINISQFPFDSDSVS